MRNKVRCVSWNKLLRFLAMHPGTRPDVTASIPPWFMGESGHLQPAWPFSPQPAILCISNNKLLSTCMKPHASPNSSSIISLKHVNENSLRSHILAVLFKISLYLGDSMSYTPIFRHNQTYVTVDLLVVCFAWAHTPQHAMLWSSVNSHFIYHILGQSLQQGSFFWILLIEWRSRSVWVQMCDTNADNEQ